jgi:hypothetical protein
VKPPGAPGPPGPGGPWWLVGSKHGSKQGDDEHRERCFNPGGGGALSAASRNDVDEHAGTEGMGGWATM